MELFFLYERIIFHESLHHLSWIWEKFQDIRLHYKMTMKQFGKVLGVSASSCYRYEHETAKRIPEDVYECLITLCICSQDVEILYSLVKEDDSVDEEILRLQDTIKNLREENDHLRALLTSKWIKEWEGQNRLYEITKKHKSGIEKYLPDSLRMNE